MNGDPLSLPGVRLQRIRRRYRGYLALLLGSTLLAGGPLSLAADEGASRIQQLIYGEALFHHQQEDHFSAITRLQLAHENGQLALTPAETAVLVTRLKLAYGLRDEAEVAFRTLLDDAVAEEVRNRAWYELAKAFFHKNQPAAAKRALDNVRGSIAEDIQGPYRLLLAHVLMALGLNAEAAAVLEQWNDGPSLAGYAYYNRGIALVRAGRLEQALPSLQRVARMPATGEERLSLRDKANLTLGYALIRLGDLPRARSYLSQVRLQGPSSNRALLATGWIAQQEGRTADALAPWMALRDRPLTDPAVQESLLAVPAAHRELQSPELAAQDYEVAVQLFSRELERVNEVMRSLRQTANADAQSGTLSGAPSEALSGTLSEMLPGTDADSPTSSYLGPLLASRVFQQTTQGQADLQSMQKHLDQGLETVDRLQSLTSDRPAAAQTSASKRAPAGKPEATAAGAKASAGNGAPSGALKRPHWQRQSPQPEARRPAGGIPSLPEVDLPAERQIQGFPPVFRGLPTSEVIGFPQSEVIGFPRSEVIGFPKSEVIGFPPPATFRMPESDDDFAYPDEVAGEAHRRRPSAGSLRRIIRPDTGPADEPESREAALAELANALAASGERIKRLIGRFQRGESRSGEMAGYLDVLRERMLQLRERITLAIGRYQRFTHALALQELQRRQQQLQANLEQARLELAKSYDAAGAGYDAAGDE